VAICRETRVDRMPKSEARDLTYSEAIEQVMLKNGYYAPLKLIYRDVKVSRLRFCDIL
jgi:hypothetical protein